jgi:hypothetical protein
VIGRSSRPMLDCPAAEAGQHEEKCLAMNKNRRRRQAPIRRSRTATPDNVQGTPPDRRATRDSHRATAVSAGATGVEDENCDMQRAIGLGRFSGGR